MSARSSFVDVDLAILSKRYQVLINTYRWQKKALVPFFMIHQLFVLFKNAFSVKQIMISSGGYWSLVPVVFGKLFSIPVFIILNGSDCASLPLVNYGNLRKPGLKQVCRLSYEYATLLLPVSESLVSTQNNYFSHEHADQQGYRHFFPDIKTKYTVVFNGLDGCFWKKDPGIEKEKNSFLSVFSQSQYILKGGDLIVAVARRFPECTFYMAGLKQPPGETEVSGNIRFLGHLKPGELLQYYSRSQFHFQLSVFEGFGCTLCEAMLCQCIPIGSAVNFIPGIIGETGFILKHRDNDLLEELIQQALACEDKEIRGESARQRVLENFSIENREQQLYALIEQNKN